ncbi:MAG: class I SAM-dependent methyltransferase [Chloroflexi bacterium]|nr:class I SAM-dependent methyltransferase [Chloroflexota bacterium]
MTTGNTERQPGHEWVDAERVDQYIQRMDEREDAERRPIFEYMARLIGADPDAGLSVLDIGSGYGPVAAVVLDAYPKAHAIGLDISEAMMAVGRERMARFGERFRYMVGDFGPGVLPPEAVEAGPFDVVVSARAIHHLSAELMASLYADIHKNLRPGGSFFNLDTASPETDAMRDRYRAARRAEHPEDVRPAATAGEPRHTDMFPHHRDATLVRHLEWLKAAGYAAYDCFYKKADRALIGGFKAA